jgi:hypothetical protein
MEPSFLLIDLRPLSIPWDRLPFGEYIVPFIDARQAAPSDLAYIAGTIDRSAREPATSPQRASRARLFSRAFTLSLPIGASSPAGVRPAQAFASPRYHFAFAQPTRAIPARRECHCNGSRQRHVISHRPLSAEERLAARKHKKRKRGMRDLPATSRQRGIPAQTEEPRTQGTPGVSGKRHATHTSRLLREYASCAAHRPPSLFGALRTF